jgi:hypothetical protein
LEAFHVSDIQTTFEPEAKKRSRVSKAHEHEKRSESAGSAAGKGPRPFGCLEIVLLGQSPRWLISPHLVFFFSDRAQISIG